MSRAEELEARFALQIRASIAAKEALLLDTASCIEVASLLIDTYRSGGCLLVFGNGGSAADAQHIAGEFVGRFNLERRALAAHALTVNTSILTAIGNDYSFDRIFSRQVEAIGRPGDVAIGLSTSGNATNVVEGLKAARSTGMTTVAMTGREGGRCRYLADHWVAVPTDDVPRVQESHIMIGHIWSGLVESALFNNARADHDRVP